MPPLFISSVQNPRVKEVVRLRDRKGRDEQGRTVIDGPRELYLAMQAGVTVVEAYVCPELCRDAETEVTRRRLDETSAEIIHVTPTVFAKLAYGDRSEGVLGVVETPQRTLESWQLPPQPLIAVIEGVEKPGNIGAMFRSADAAGVQGVIVTGKGTDLFNPNTIRASLGTIFSLRVVESPVSVALAWLREHGFRMYAARVDAQKLYYETDLTGPTAIVLGSEAEGLSSDWHAPDIVPIKLPMLGLADSLNVSATAAVLFYEARRQRSSR
ncbi:MAG: RNA methyltransferase [Planctomycetaceae bacterium]|nr:RNA methyltransferase [Planctomycetaceae bacterium]